MSVRRKKLQPHAAPHERVEEDRGTGNLSRWKLGALAVGLAAVTWIAAPRLFPVNLPDDYPKLPDLGESNQSLRSAVQAADEEARNKPGSADAMGKLAMVYHANLFSDEAARAYRIAARLAPDDYRWAYGQASVYEEVGNEKDEVRMLQRTVQLKPDHVPALLKLADAAFKRDNLDEAAHYYERASNSPDGRTSLQAAYGLGRVAARRKDWNGVVTRIGPISAGNPNVQQFHELLQEAFDALRQPAKAAQERDAVPSSTIKFVPPPEDALNDQLIGLCYSSTRLLKHAGMLIRLGYPDRAVQAARRAAQIDPADPDIRSFMARTLLSYYGDKPPAVDEALTHLEECLRLKSDDLTPLWGFTNDFFDSPKSPQSIERLRKLLLPHSNLPDSHFYIGLVADAQGNTTEAVAEYEAALKHNRKDSAVHNKLGLIANREGKLDAAIAHFETSIDLDPMNLGARRNLGVSLLQKGNDARGLKELREVLRLKPSDAATYFCMGFAALYAKRTDEAIARFREGLRYKADDPEAHFGLASALALRSQWPDAAAELQAALRLRPDYPEARKLLADMQH